MAGEPASAIAALARSTRGGLLLIATSWLVFGPTLAAVSPFQQLYAVIPILTWIAVRFGPRGAATASFVVAAIAITATSLSIGPFARETLRGGLMALQVFVAFDRAEGGISPRKMLEIAAARGDARFQNGEIERTGFVFLDEANARAHLDDLWCYGHEVWAIVDGDEVRLDLDHDVPAVGATLG